MTPVTTSHIVLDDNGTAWIGDTNVKVVEVALEKLAHGESADEIFAQHGGHLSLAQIHAALAYYFDHQAEYDAEIDRQLQDFDAARSRNLDSPGRRKLRALGRLP